MTVDARRPRRPSHRLDPALPMLAFGVAVAISPEFEFLGLKKIRASDLLLPILFLVFAGAAATRGRREKRPEPVPLLGIMALVLAWDFTAWALFSEEGPRMLGLMYLVKRAVFCLVYILGVNAVQSRWGWERIIHMFVLASPILNLSVLWEMSQSTANARASGIISHQETSTALFIVVTLGLVLGAWPAMRPTMDRLALGLASATGVAALLATGSRAGLLCAVLLGALQLWRDRRRRAGLLILLVTVGAAAWLLMPEVLQERFASAPEELTSAWRGVVEDPELMPSAGSSSVAARVLVAQHVLREVIPRSPVYGLGTARLQLGLVDDFFLTEWIYHGLVGLALFLLLLGSMVRALKQAAQTSDDPLSRGVAQGLLATLVVLIVSGLSAETFYLIRPMEAFMLLLGITVGRARLQEPQA